MFIDSHAHIYLDQFDSDRPEMIERALEEDVSRILMPNIDSSTIDRMLETSEKWPTICQSMIGLHPCSVKKNFETELYLVEDWLSKSNFLAIGEIGTDLYWDKSFFNEQKEAFRIQCELALKYSLPIVIHCRESMDETIALVKEYKGRGLAGVFHCFTGNEQQAKEICELGFFLGIGGVLTFKKGGIFEIVKSFQLDRLVLETDSPYLAPTPLRGKRNEPSNVPIIANKLSEALNLEISEIEEITSSNCRRLFQV